MKAPRTPVRRYNLIGWLAAGLAAACPPAGAAGLTLVGVGDQVRENVLAHLDLDDEPCDAPEWRVRQRFDAAPGQARAALQAFGFYHAEIDTALELEEPCWSARITIRAGDPVRIRTLELRLEGEAEDDPPFAAALAASGLAPGAPLHHGRYEQLKRTLLSLTDERGYVHAVFSTARVDVYPDERAADVRLHLDSGRRYRFGEIELRQDVLREPLLLGYMDFERGDPYDARRLTDFYVALTNSGYFNTIDVRPGQPDEELREIPVEVTLTPAPRRLITYGLGFSTDTGPRVRFGRNNRRWNERGHQFGVNAQLSPVISEVTVNYRFPFGDPRTEFVSFDGGTRVERTDTSESESLQLGARRVVELNNNWTRTQRLNLLFEDFEVAGERGSSHLLMPGLEWTRLRADNAIRPRNGSRLDFEIRAASEELGSDATFVQALAKAKWIHSLASGARILMRGELGATWEGVPPRSARLAVDELDALPPSVRFFAGGDASVRGYRYASLGPENEQGEVIGGPGLLTASIEYEHPVRQRWSVAAFVDSGNAFRGGSDFDLMTGVGIGARWHSPLGPIRFDVAHPLDHPSSGVRLHLSLGPDLCVP